MRVLHVYNQHRGGNGGNNATKATIGLSRQHGLEVEVFKRSSRDLANNLMGRLQAGATAIYAPASLRKFTALLESFKPDVVHTYDLFPLISPWILPACTRREIPVVMTCDDYILTCPVRNHFRNGQICTRCIGGHEYWAVLKNCRHDLPESLTLAFYTAMVRKLHLFRRHISRFIVASEFTRQWFIERADIQPERVTTIPYIVEIPESSADPSAGQYAAFAGRFVPEKGIDTFLEASRLCGLPFRLCRDEHFFVTIPIPPDANVVIAHNRQELEAFYRGARMLVFPSIWFETFGIVGAEAMSHGIPVIGSRIGAISNLVEDGVDGLLFEPGNARHLAEKVTRLWNDPDLCRRLGQAARQKAIRLWSAESHFERLLAVYEDVSASEMREIPR